MTAEIAPAAECTDDLVEGLARILPQLSSSAPPTFDEVRAIVEHPDTVLFVARLDGAVVGSLTLVFYRIPTGLKAWIEDVVVDDAAGGNGIGRALTEAAIATARERGAKDVSLTSRPSRERANRLYQRIGFESRQTNVYRYKL